MKDGWSRAETQQKQTSRVVAGSHGGRGLDGRLLAANRHGDRRTAGRPRAGRGTGLSGAAGAHQSVSPSGWLLSEWRGAQPDHGQADLPGPKDAGNPALDCRVLEHQRQRHGVHVQAARRCDVLRRHPAGCGGRGQELRHLWPGQQVPEAAGVRSDQQLRTQRGGRSADREVLLQQAVARLPAGHVGDRLRPGVAVHAGAALRRAG